MATKQFTTVSIKNETGLNFLSVGVSHKYSNKYSHHKEWLNVTHGSTPSEPLLIEYNTGFLTTGRDWWKVIAVTDDGKIFQTDPVNFRSLVDFAEQGLDKFGWAIASAAGKATAASGGLLAPITGGVTVVSALLTIMSNSESTAGYKQFFLEEKDASHGIQVILRPDEVEFRGVDSTATTPFALAGYVEKITA